MTTAPSAPTTSSARDVSVFDIANAVLERWHGVVAAPIAAAVLAFGVTYLIPPRYTAETSFVPDQRSGGTVPADLAGIARQFGLALGNGPEASADFYAQLVKSRTLLEELLLAPAPPESPGDTLGRPYVLSVLHIEGRTHADSLANGVRRLRDAIGVAVDRRTNIITVTVEARSANLSAGLASRLVALVDRFNTERRQSRAGIRRRFVEARLEVAGQELAAGEDAVRRFLGRNRVFRGAPDLEFQYESLQRQLSVAQEVYLSLRREYESSRIEEVNDVPVITVIDTAVPPRRKSSPKRLITMALTFVSVGAMAVLAAVGRTYVHHLHLNQVPEFVEFRRRYGAVGGEIRNWARLRRR